jgi:hypothetical protein
MKCRLRLVSLAALLLAGASEAADDFTNARLSAGMEAYRSRRYAEASDQLRVACFGLLDKPEALTEALVWLAIAQEAAGRTADVTVTVNRFLEVERRFSAYARLRLEPATRAAFEGILRARATPEALASVPAFAAPGKAGATPEARKQP